MSLLTLQMPTLPDPVKVVLQPATTALLMFDMIDRICKNQPNCTGVMVPALASLLARGTKSRRVRPVFHSGAGELEVDAGGRSRSRRPDRQVVCSGPILQHGSRQNAEGRICSASVNASADSFGRPVMPYRLPRLFSVMVTPG